MEALLYQLKKNPENIRFEQVMNVIEHHYHYSPAAFTNGLGKKTLNNAAGTNEASCRIFAFAQLHKLSEAEVLACFGEHYRNNVLQHPEGQDHQNIRNFMKYGWQGIQFDAFVLKPK